MVHSLDTVPETARVNAPEVGEPLTGNAEPSPDGEGVETGWEPPDRVTAKVKAQSRPRTLDGESGGES